jgi:GH24 family phage-related lysozyme (muramidase)
VRQSVADAFPSFSRQYEGYTTWPYLDVKGLVTVGVGNLIDPMQEAIDLPWQVDGQPATDDQIRAGWIAVKGSQAGMVAAWYQSRSGLRLTDAAVDELVRSRAAQMDAVLARRFPSWASLCADAQLGTMSLAWACGPMFTFPRFEAALDRGDFTTCAFECQMGGTAANPGIIPRNNVNRGLFFAAQRVTDQGLDPSGLHYNPYPDGMHYVDASI